MSAAADVACRPAGDGWKCRVRVGPDPGATEHEVSVSAAELAAYAPRAAEPTELVAVSFAYLLEREPREALLRQFSLGTIERYFPDYRAEILRRL